MPSYLLLRNNKQTGPHSLNDIIALGLKPYDLVWVEGRSAAWRYPSEIAELKEYAPAVEEQPFDRFYKKSEETVKEEPVRPVEIKKEPVRPVEIKQEPVKREPVPVSNNNETYRAYQPQNKKPIFVSMPASAKTHVQQNAQPVEKKPQPTIYNEPREIKSYPTYDQSTYNNHSYKPIDDFEEEPILEKKYSQSLDEIKEMYVNTLQQRKTKNRRKEIVKKYMKPVLASTFLVICGVIIGYMLTRNSSSMQASESLAIIPKQSQNEIPDNQEMINNPQQDAGNLSNVKNTNKETPLLVIQNGKQKNKVLQADNKSAEQTEVKDPSEILQDQSATQTDKKDVDVDPVTGERIKQVRDGDEIQSAQKENTENTSRRIADNDTKDLRKMVSVKSNEYIRGPFGGIKDLKLTVANDSKYFVDEVKVELVFLKPSREALRTDHLTFRNISPNGTVTVKIPDSQRGVKVDYKITRIESKQFQKSTAGL